MIGKTVLITGAAAGLGKACADLLAGEGMAVAVADIDGKRAEETAKAICAGGGRAIAVTMDVSDEAAVNAGVERCVRELGGLDALVSNAGVQIVHPFEDYPFEDWQKMLRIHADGAFLCGKAAYAHMKRTGKGGQIVFMGSVHSHDASPLKAAYCFAKHGILGLCRVIAKEGAPYGIHAYTVCPGFVRTALVEKQIPEQARELGIGEEDVVRNIMLKNTVDGKFTTADEVASAVAFAIGDSGGAMTGQSLILSHGWCMK
ncbi:MAG: 3-hydroxybutyrate dehydrogenase [Clostridiales Family XIII bacterium]|jgi:3-hydroxybutyrate dehydrogenase|nr:3-hydroxybutyrate dehydrogenase [Clostridiales Family XIII bacterium]